MTFPEPITVAQMEAVMGPDQCHIWSWARGEAPEVNGGLEMEEELEAQGTASPTLRPSG